MSLEQRQAEVDAEQDAKTDTNKLIWFIAGFLGNFIGVLIAYIYQPEPRCLTVLGEAGGIHGVLQGFV